MTQHVRIGPATLRETQPTATWYRPLSTLGWEASAVVVLLFLVGTDVLEHIREAPNGSLILQVSWALVYLAVGFLMFHRFGREWLDSILRRQMILCALVAVALASAFWSVDPFLSFRRAISLVGTTLLGVLIGYYFTPRQMMRVLFWTFSILIVSSIFVAILFPEYGRSANTIGHWQGLTSNKNFLGAIAVSAAAFFLIATLSGRIDRVLGFILFGLSVLTVVMAQSATAIVMLCGAVLAIGAFIISKRQRFPALATLLLLIVGLGYSAFLLTLVLEQFVSLLGRDPTLTSRTDVWTDARAIIAARPWTGYGYSAVWGHEAVPVLPQHLRTHAQWAGHAHNGFLNTATELGLPAAVLAAAYLLQTMLRSVQAFARWSAPFALFAIGYCFALLVGNITETHFLGAQRIEWILFVAVSVAVLRSLERGAHRKPPGRSRRRRRTSDKARLTRAAETALGDEEALPGQRT